MQRIKTSPSLITPLILLSLIFQASPQTTTSIYNHNETVFSVDYSQETVLYITNSTVMTSPNTTLVETKISNLTAISCFKETPICIIAGSAIVASVNTTEKQIVQTFEYKTEKVLDFISMTVETIDKTDYFLVGLQNVHGIMRWSLQNNEKHERLLLNETFPKR